MSERRGLSAPYFLAMAAIVALDQLTKAVVDRLMILHQSHDLVEDFLRLTYVRNRGAAFGILSDAELPYQAALFAAMSLLALLAIGVYAWRLPVSSRLPKAALAMIMGGAVGNLLDRVRLGYVIDFVDVYVGPYHWPAFNVADSAITVGVVLLVLDMLRHPHREAREPMAAMTEPAVEHGLAGPTPRPE